MGQKNLLAKNKIRVAKKFKLKEILVRKTFWLCPKMLWVNKIFGSKMGEIQNKIVISKDKPILGIKLM